MGEEVAERIWPRFPPVEHPLVRTHPGHRPARAVRVRAVHGPDRRACTATRATRSSGTCSRHTEDPNFSVRWRWTEGDVAVWDEASTNHRALSDHFPAHRVMRRCTVDGTARSSSRRLPAVILSDVTIREELAAGRIVIDPLGDQAVQPSSVDLHVDRYFRVFRNDTTPYIDPKQHQEDLTELVEVGDDGAFILHPGEFVLGSTLERVALPDDLVARLEGKSSLGRLGLLIHSSLPAARPSWCSTTACSSRGRSVTWCASSSGLRRRLRSRHLRGRVPRDHGLVRRSRRQDLEITLHSGRRVRVTAGHNLFTLDRDGDLQKVRTGELGAGVRVAVPRRIPDPTSADRRRSRWTSSRSRSTPTSSARPGGPRRLRRRRRRPRATVPRPRVQAHRLLHASSAAAVHLAAEVDGLVRTDGSAKIASWSRARVPDYPHAARRSRGRVAPRHLRRRGVTAAVSSSSSRTPINRSSTGSKRCCTRSGLPTSAR